MKQLGNHVNDMRSRFNNTILKGKDNSKSVITFETKIKTIRSTMHKNFQLCLFRETISLISIQNKRNPFVKNEIRKIYWKMKQTKDNPKSVNDFKTKSKTIGCKMNTISSFD